jgi:hypothetical protein
MELDSRVVDVSGFERYSKRVAMDDDGDGCEDTDGVEGVPLMQPSKTVLLEMAFCFSVGRWCKLSWRRWWWW